MLITKNRHRSVAISTLPPTVNMEHIAFICNVPLCIFSFSLIFVFVEKTKVHGDMEKRYKMYLGRKLKFIAICVGAGEFFRGGFF